MNGKSHQKSISKVSQTSLSLAIEVLIPMVLGMVAIIAHARFRSHINLPGHHGLEFMALLLIANLTSKFKWSSFFFSMGIASFVFMPFLGFKSPMVALVYVLPGIVYGLFSLIQLPVKKRVWFVGIIGGLAYASIPLSRFLIFITTGWVHKSVVAGLGFPFLSFFTFGLMGTLIGIGAHHLVKKFFK